MVGDKSAWEVALKKQVWGFARRYQGLWSKIEINDLMAFYVTSPIKKIIGFAKITGKYMNDSELIWKDELFFKRNVWPYKINFEIYHTVEDWESGIDPPQGIMLNTGRKVITEKIFKSLINDGNNKWKIKIDVPI